MILVTSIFLSRLAFATKSGLVFQAKSENRQELPEEQNGKAQLVTAAGVYNDIDLTCLRVAQVNLTQATVTTMARSDQVVTRTISDLRLTFVTNKTLCDFEDAMKDLAVSDLVTVLGYATAPGSMEIALSFPAVNITSQHDMDIPLQVLFNSTEGATMNDSLIVLVLKRGSTVQRISQRMATHQNQRNNN